MYGSQSRFVRHAPCPRCNSRDNLAVYEGGTGFCFGCGYFQKRTEAGSPTLGHVGHVDSTMETHPTGADVPSTHSGIRPPPDDCISYFPPVVVKWISKYDLAPVDLINHNVCWSPSREQLIYRFFGEGKDVVLWQARNFREGTTHKRRFFTSGSPAQVIARYSTAESRDTAVIVEDCISAIKCSYAGVDGVPCFSAAMPREKLSRLVRMYRNIIVWLDEDKMNEARAICTQAAMLGAHSKLVYTEADPKEYPVTEIKRLTEINA